MEIIRPGTEINFIGGRKVAAIASGVAVVVAVLAYLFLAKFGVDFTGGTEIHIKFYEVPAGVDPEDIESLTENPMEIAQVRRMVSSLNLSDDSVQSFGGADSGEFLVRVQHINFGAEESFQAIKGVLEAEYGAEAFTDWVFDPAEDLKMTVVPAERMDPLAMERLLITKGVLPAPRVEAGAVPQAEAEAATETATETEAETETEVEDAVAGDDDSAGDDDDSADAVVAPEPVEEPEELAPIIDPYEQPDTDWVVRDARYSNGMTIALPGIAKKLEEQFASSDELPASVVAKIIKVDSIGEKVGAQLRTQGLLAILVTLGLILLYTAFRFELSFAPGAVLALLHDVIIVGGVFSLFGVVFGFEFNLPTIGALMTIVGYSLNDTIVVFDRIRENVRRFKRKELSWIINTSINECLSRTLLTSATTFFVVLMLAVFGGPILRGFAVALLAGIVVGTYSSIFVASPVILVLQRWLPIQTKPAA